MSKGKPPHLAPKYGAQWQDPTMAVAYRHRPPYPSWIFDRIVELAQPGPVLEIGSGTGDATVELQNRFDQIDAVELSTEMLAIARERVTGHVTFIQEKFEEAELSPPYGLAIAAESMHWTDWEISFRKVARALAPGAMLVMIDRAADDVPWIGELKSALHRYSTNKDFVSFDFFGTLAERGLFSPTGGFCTLREISLQAVDDYVESFHSRNGLSRDRMPPADAAAFDEAIREMVRPHLQDGMVPVPSSTRVHWGVPSLDARPL